ncbi:MAG: spore coat protein CotJB [Clostridia bacterium]|nr:spore coat protein CotJB [Clostridia bacterium]MBR2926253.1 spore coat protein CotJB [Clostridia bacterium]
MMKHKPCNACRDSLALLRALDFSIQETVLYLDAYPDCQEALAYYHKLVCERDALMSSYQEQCGPLSIYGNRSKTSWDWVNGPWPWEIEANE